MIVIGALFYRSFFTPTNSLSVSHIDLPIPPLLSTLIYHHINREIGNSTFHDNHKIVPYSNFHENDIRYVMTNNNLIVTQHESCRISRLSKCSFWNIERLLLLLTPMRRGVDLYSHESMGSPFRMFHSIRHPT